jgi:Opacity protein and related surface antigens
MKKISILAIIVTAAISVSAQSSKESKSKIGVKAGYNFSNVVGSQSSFDPKHNSGYMVAVAFAAGTKNGLGYRSELVYSKQGYSFDDGGKNTDVMNDYLYMPHLMTYTIAKVVQIQAGAQVGVLLNAKKSSGGKDSAITDLMNRFDYGFAGGVEVYPFKGLIIGARYNLGLGKMYKQYEQTSTTPYPLPFDPSTTNLKNGILQLFLGYRF